MAVLVDKRAPSFKTTAVIDGKAEEAFSLGRYLSKKHMLFYFYPADFSRVPHRNPGISGPNWQNLSVGTWPK